MRTRLAIIYTFVAVSGMMWFLPHAIGSEEKTAFRVQMLCTSDRQGEIEPCGCPTLRLGGLDRESWLIDNYRKTEGRFLVLDTGGFSKFRMTAGIRARTAYLLRGMREIGFDAINVGREDDRLLRDTIEESFSHSIDASLLSANVVGPESEKRIYRPYRMVEWPLAGQTERPLKICLIGLSYDDSYRNPIAGSVKNIPNYVGPVADNSAVDFIESARQIVEAVDDQCDLIVVLGQLDWDMNEELAEKVPQIDLIICGPPPGTAMRRITQKQVGKVWIVETGSYLGRYMAKLYVEGTREDGITDLKTFRVRILKSGKRSEAISEMIDEFREKFPDVKPSGTPGSPDSSPGGIGAWLKGQ